MIIVSDTSPISGLLIIDRLHILEDLYEEVIIPEAVYEELSVLRRFGFDTSKLDDAHWISVRNPSDPTVVSELMEELDQGESAAIALALELQADSVIIDEKKGREIALKLGLEIIGLIGILLATKKQGIVDQIRPILDDLIQRANFRVSGSLYQTILKRVGEW